MTIKTQWLDWLEARADRLQERYRQAWTRLPRRSPRQETFEPEEPASKRWCTIHAKVARQQDLIVVQLELPAPHAVEADVRVIGATLAIAVLRNGSGIKHARVEDCYRRAIPLPELANPETAVYEVHGDELVIRMEPKAITRRSPGKSSSGRKRASDKRAGGSLDRRLAEQVPRRQAAAGTGKVRQKKRASQVPRGPAQVTELPVGAARQQRPDRTRP